MNKLKLVAKKSKFYRVGLMVLMSLLIVGCNNTFSASPTPIPLPAVGGSDSSSDTSSSSTSSSSTSSSSTSSSSTSSSSTSSGSTEAVAEGTTTTESGEANSSQTDSGQMDSSQGTEGDSGNSDAASNDAAESSAADSNAENASSTDSTTGSNSDQGSDDSPAMVPTATTEAGTAETSSTPAQGVALGQAVEPVQLEIERISMAVPITPMEWRIVKIGDQRTTEWVIPESSAGWHPDSAGAGAAGNVIISGYQNVGESVFSQLALGNVQEGQEILLTDADGMVYTYLVSEVGTPIPLDGASAAERERVAEYYAASDDARLTLVTGWPAFTTTHRLFVVATLVQN